MLTVDKDKKIKLNRGDAGGVGFDITNDDGTPYAMDADDELVFTVLGSGVEFFTVRSAAGSNVVDITAQRSDSLGVGRYTYKLQLCKADGSTRSVIPRGVLEICRG